MTIWMSHGGVEPSNDYVLLAPYGIYYSDNYQKPDRSTDNDR